MKKFIFVFAVLLGTTAIAQNKKNYGAKAKNSKPWQKVKTTTKILVNTFEKNNLKGAAFKNTKIWNREISDEKILITRDTKRRKLQGPKAKNYKPWNK